MSVVSGLYGCVALFLYGFILGVQTSECKTGIKDMLVAFFFSAIWPITIAVAAYLGNKKRKGDEK